MGIKIELIGDISKLLELESDWEALCQGNPHLSLFQSPAWIMPWWHAYHLQLGATLHVYAGFADSKLIGIAPFYKRRAKVSPGLKVNEIRLMGDAGPRPPSLDLVVDENHQDAFGALLGETLSSIADEWDVLDLEPLREPARARAFMASKLAVNHLKVSARNSGGVKFIELQSFAKTDPKDYDKNTRFRVYQSDEPQLRKGLAALRRLSRLEWADRDEASPLCDQEATQFLENVVVALGEAGQARLIRLDDNAGEATAALLVVDVGDTAVVLANAVDAKHNFATKEMLEFEAQKAFERGMRRLELGPGLSETSLPELPFSSAPSLRFRCFGKSRSATLAKTYGKVRRRVELAKGAPEAAAAGARAAWSKIRVAAANVTGFEKMHLVRGELWSRGLSRPEGLMIRSFDKASWDTLDDSQQEEYTECLNLNHEDIESFWSRGDHTVIGYLHEKPAGIAWSAGGTLTVPELDKDIHLRHNEAYIHNVYVAPQARGLSVAPIMLEEIAIGLRNQDVYRAWALIGTENVASLRAFEKAAYTAVADVIRNQVGSINTLKIRPPDEEAERLFGKN